MLNKFGCPPDSNMTVAFLGGDSLGFWAGGVASAQAYPSGAASARISRTKKHSQQQYFLTCCKVVKTRAAPAQLRSQGAGHAGAVPPGSVFGWAQLDRVS